MTRYHPSQVGPATLLGLRSCVDGRDVQGTLRVPQGGRLRPRTNVAIVKRTPNLYNGPRQFVHTSAKDPSRLGIQGRVGRLFEEIYLQTRGLENPGPLWRTYFTRTRSRVRFRGGLVLPVNPLSFQTIRKLVHLTALGAILATEATLDPPRWGVNLESGLLTTPTGVRFTLESLHPTVFAETFIDDLHFPGHDVADSNIIDVGGFVGDTALYFARLGASVHSYEPYEESMARFRKNLALNPNLAKRITPWPEAVWEDRQVSFTPSGPGDGSIFLERTSSLPVSAVSLRTALNRLDGPAYLLKLDCKGAEYEIVSQPALREFKALHIEYATALRPGRTPDELLSVLRDQGFTRIRRFKHNRASFNLDEFGMIHAERTPPV